MAKGSHWAALRSLRFVGAYEPMTNVWSLKLDRYLPSPAKLAFKGVAAVLLVQLDGRGGNTRTVCSCADGLAPEREDDRPPADGLVELVDE